MKKIKKIYSKTNILLMVFMLILSNFMPIFSAVKAVDIGEKVNLVSLGECAHDLGVNNGYVVTELVGYYRNGTFYPAYCLNRELHGASSNFTYDLDVDHMMKDTETYNKVWRVMMAGYPYNTPEKMGVSSWEKAYQATKMAIYCVTGQRKIEEFFAYTPEGQEIVDCIWRLYNASKSNNLGYKSPICNMEKEGIIYSEKINGKEYYIQKYKFSGNNEMPSFTVIASEGIIFNMQNEQQNNYNGNGSFKLAIQKDQLKQDKQINLKAKATIKTYPILYGATTIPGTQDYCLSTYPFEATEASTNLKITVPSVTIKKVDKNTNLALKGAEFNIYRDTNENGKLENEDSFVIKTGATNDAGTCTITGLAPGKYIAKEVKAPEGYLLDTNTIQTFEIEANGEDIILQFGDIEPLGKITIYKTNNLGDKLKEAEFQIVANEDIKNFTKTKTYYKKGQIVSTVTTDLNGQAIANDLPLGNYLIKETKAPNGYLLNGNTYNVNLLYKDQNTAIINYTIDKIIDEEPCGIISIIKNDAETKNMPQGDSKIAGAEYKVYAAEDIYNSAKTKKYYSKDEVIATRIIKADGTTEDVTNLPLGNYYVKETKAPEGYLIDDNIYKVNLSYKDQTTKVIKTNVISKENVKKRQVNIFKSGIKILSGLVPGLEGVEFTIKLNSNVENALSQGYSYSEIWNGIDEYGNKDTVDINRVEEAQKIAPTISKVVTDKTGNAYTDMLPYGKYIVKETNTPQDYETASDFTFSITQDESEIKENSKKILRYVVNNEQLESYVKLVKKDKTTGQIITASSTSFKIKAKEDIIDRVTKKVIWNKGEYITQKVGKTIYDTFTTNSKNLIVSQKKNSFSSILDDLGTVVTPLKLPVGSYEIEEIETPEGFLKLEKNIEFEIKGVKDYDKNQNGDNVKKIEIFNEQITGKISLTKKIIYANEENVNISLLNTSDLSEIEFKLTAKEDILSKIDNSVIYGAGTTIGIYKLSKEGKLEIDNLAIGTYNLEEIKTIDGLIINKEPIEVSIDQQHYEKEISVENKTTLVQIEKIDKDSKKQVAGAKLAIYDENDKKIVSWISGETPYKIEGLSVNKEYKIKELEAPNEYYLLEDNLKFNVSDSEELQKVEVSNEIVLKNIIINKKDSETFNLINSDFSFGLFEDKKCTKLIKTANSDNNGTIFFKDLKVGIYYIKETIAPEYYKLSDKVLKVEIKADKQKGIVIDDEVQDEKNYTAEIDFKNEIQKGKIKIKKVDSADNSIKLEGIEFKIFDKQGNFIEKLITDSNGIALSSDLRCDTDYVLIETQTIEGYVLNDNPIEFRVNNEETKEIKIENEKVKIQKVLPKTGF